MKIELTTKQVCKILSTISLDELNDRLDYNWIYWDISKEGDKFMLVKHQADEKAK